MKYTTLPNTNLTVSKICLGTMTFGNQNTEQDAHNQLDYAIEQGINFLDTAEMYPIGGNQNIFGNTERHIGSYLKKIGPTKREKLIIATKIAGPNRGLEYIRQPLDFSKKSITQAVDLSLQNLQTEYIDLYQTHWPERIMNMFGKRGITQIDTQWQDNFLEVLHTFDQIIKQGKIKNIGVSNEAPWGVMKLISLSQKHNLPKIATIQNPYSLLNRLFEVGLAEVCMREQISLLAYSPLGFGILTGKHLQGTQPNSRIDLFPQFTRYTGKTATIATQLYQKLAQDNNLTITQLALAFVYNQPFVASTIIGATTMQQLKENIDAQNTTLSTEILTKIEQIQETQPNPAP